MNKEERIQKELFEIMKDFYAREDFVRSALGLKPGEGGSSYMEGYSAARRDLENVIMNRSARK